VKTIEEVLAEHGGVFAKGVHCSKNGPPAECCILEMEALRLGIPCTDKPELVRMWDLRGINDAAWSSRDVATPHLLRLHAAYVGSMDWPQGRQRKVLERIVIFTVNRIVSRFPGLPKNVAEKCKSARTVEEAQSALDLALDLDLDLDLAHARDLASDLDLALDLALALASAIATDEALILAVDVWVDAASEPAP
jgi:hypothetical protein